MVQSADYIARFIAHVSRFSKDVNFCKSHNKTTNDRVLDSQTVFHELNLPQKYNLDETFTVVFSNTRPSRDFPQRRNVFLVEVNHLFL